MELRNDKVNIAKLYKLCMRAVVGNYHTGIYNEIFISPFIRCDLFCEFYEQNLLTQLEREFSNINNAIEVLKVQRNRLCLHQCFQALMNRCFAEKTDTVAGALSRGYVILCSDVDKIVRYISFGLLTSSFLFEAGWYTDSEVILKCALTMICDSEEPDFLMASLKCCCGLLQIYNANWNVKEGEEIYKVSLSLIEKLHLLHNERQLLALMYSEFSQLYVILSNYVQAYHWSIKALKELRQSVSAPTIVTVLRQSSKLFVLRHSYDAAAVLIKQAVIMAKDIFGCGHLKYADTLSDYGFFLLNTDAHGEAVEVYQTVLNVRKGILNGVNLMVARAHEDLGFALYAHNYAIGDFISAKKHAEDALNLMEMILPSSHLLLSSCGRVKALILEEMAIDSHSDSIKKQYFAEAHKQHVSALEQARKIFGDMHVLTAKHYGNLGRLYQSMRQYDKAEEMLLRAISIKERLFGADDSEVAVTVSYLACLYNYNMKKYTQAEHLYLRSISTGKSFFGDAYTGLEYDYRGLIDLYGKLGNNDKYLECTNELRDWESLRTEAKNKKVSPLLLPKESCDISFILQQVLTKS